MNLSARRAEAADAALLWRWANDPETRRRSFNKAPIPYADHLGWFACRLASDRVAIWIFSDGTEPVGQVRVEVDDGVAEGAADVAAVSIVVAPDRRGRGYGKSMLAAALPLLRRDFGPGIRVRALLLDDNEASFRLFRACGFRVVGPAAREDGQRAIVLELDEPSWEGEPRGVEGHGR